MLNRSTACLSRPTQVMDYSILVGIDEENNDILIGIIDYVRVGPHRWLWAQLGGRRNSRHHAGLVYADPPI